MQVRPEEGSEVNVFFKPMQVHTPSNEISVFFKPQQIAAGGNDEIAVYFKPQQMPPIPQQPNPLSETNNE